MRGPVAKLDALTGLRFFAAFAVFVHHFGDRFKFLDYDGPLGAQAVSFFFVLSGFILTYVYQGRLKPGTIKKFYFTRWARIWPLHAVCLLAVLLLFPYDQFFGSPYDQLKTASHVALLQSWVPLKSWVFCHNGVAWSISTEMFFYLMFPLLFLGGQSRFWKKYITLAVLTLAGLYFLRYLATVPSVTSAISIKQVIHMNPAFRLLEFATGMATGFVFLNRSPLRQTRPIWVDTLLESCVLVIALGYDWFFRTFLVYYTVKTSSWGGNELATAMVFSGGLFFYAPLIYVFARSQGLWARFAGWKPIAYLGEISFALYMVHPIVLRLAYTQYWIGSTTSPITMFFATLLVTLGCSSLLFHVIEIPAKSSLLRLYAMQPWVAVTSFGKNSLQFLNSRIAWAALLLIAMPIFWLQTEKRVHRTTPEMQQIVNRTPPALRNLDLDSGTILLGWSLEPRRGGIQLNLAWQKKSMAVDDEQPAQTRAFLLVDKQAKQKKVIFPRRNFMKGFRANDIFVERYFLHANRYRNVERIELVFSPGLPSELTQPKTVKRSIVLVNPQRLAKAAELSQSTKLR